MVTDMRKNEWRMECIGERFTSHAQQWLVYRNPGIARLQTAALITEFFFPSVDMGPERLAA